MRIVEKNVDFRTGRRGECALKKGRLLSFWNFRESNLNLTGGLSDVPKVPLTVHTGQVME
jgi:hypothetical protein